MLPEARQCGRARCRTCLPGNMLPCRKRLLVLPLEVAAEEPCGQLTESVVVCHSIVRSTPLHFRTPEMLVEGCNCLMLPSAKRVIASQTVGVPWSAHSTQHVCGAGLPDWTAEHVRTVDAQWTGPSVHAPCVVSDTVAGAVSGSRERDPDLPPAITVKYTWSRAAGRMRLPENAIRGAVRFAAPPLE
jgi:hypothetical protein